jgi:hypothetical protein
MMAPFIAAGAIQGPAVLNALPEIEKKKCGFRGPPEPNLRKILQDISYNVN